MDQIFIGSWSCEVLRLTIFLALQFVRSRFQPYYFLSLSIHFQHFLTS